MNASGKALCLTGRETEKSSIELGKRKAGVVVKTRFRGMGTACCLLILLFAGCGGEGSHEVKIPVVTEESLTPEQKVQWENAKKIGGDGPPGGDGIAAHMKQMMQQEKEQATPKEGAPAS